MTRNNNRCDPALESRGRLLPPPPPPPRRPAPVQPLHGRTGVNQLARTGALALQPDLRVAGVAGPVRDALRHLIDRHAG